MFLWSDPAGMEDIHMFLWSDPERRIDSVLSTFWLRMVLVQSANKVTFITFDVDIKLYQVIIYS